MGWQAEPIKDLAAVPNHLEADLGLVESFAPISLQ